MDFDLKADGLGLMEELGVGGAAEGACEAEGFAGFQAALDFVEQEFAGFDGEFLRGERGKAAGDLVGVKETRNLIKGPSLCHVKSKSRGRDEREKAGGGVGGVGGVQEKSLIEGPWFRHLGLRMLDCGDLPQRSTSSETGDLQFQIWRFAF